MDRNKDASLPIPGRRTRIAFRILKTLFLIVLASSTFLAGLPILPSEASSVPETPSSETTESQLPQEVGFDPVPDLSLPRTVVSAVDNLIGAGGVVQDSADNLTVYNYQVGLRLLGKQQIRDELVSPRYSGLGSWSSWEVQVRTSAAWVPLRPRSNDFTILGTNATGTFVVRTMIVGSDAYSGQLNVVYKATSAGPLKWDLEFAADATADYRLVYTWNGIPDRSDLSVSSKEIRVDYGHAVYTFSWRDVPDSLNSTTTVSRGLFSLYIGLGLVDAGSKVLIDPSIVSNNVPVDSTAYTFQRKVFYESTAGYYWVFYYDGFGTKYRNSRDGVTWSSAIPIPSGLEKTGGPEIYLKTVFNSGQTVIVATGETMTSTLGSPWLGTVYVRFSIGTITGSSISWSSVQIGASVSRWCINGAPGTACTLTLGIRYVNLALTADDGSLVFSYNQFATGPGNGWCPPNTSESLVGVFHKGTYYILSCGDNNYSDPNRSVILPSSFQGTVRVVYQFHTLTGIELRAWRSDGGTVETVEGRVVSANGNEFSAVSDADYGVHVVYRVPDGSIKYAYRSVSGSSWEYTNDLFSGSAGYPSISVDYSTNDVYAFGIQDYPSVAMRKRSLAGSFFDSPEVAVVVGRTNPTHLGSNYAAFSSSNSSSISMTWTEGTGPYSVVFAFVPIQTVWSPFGNPPAPWDGNGLAPYGQYFSNLGEYVSTSSGMLTIRQTDLSIPGRGLNLDITRVYTEPNSFLSGQPYDYEKYPWAPLGIGWQLNFPWMNNVTSPLYMHLWDGQGFRIPSSFWNSPTATFENHLGEHFRLVKNFDGTVVLYTKSGVSYKFDTARKLTTITDETGNNTIIFAYDANNRVSSIRDTVQRTFLFCYSQGLLLSVNQTTGSCTSGAGSVRGLVYTYRSYSPAGLSLEKVTDSIGRATGYRYHAVGDPFVRGWLISRIDYPTFWYSNYTYAQSTRGQTISYRVVKQFVATNVDLPIRQFEYTYNLSDDQIVGSTVKTFNGTMGSLQLVSYNDYAFSFAGVTQNVSDASHRLVRGTQQRFGTRGEVAREIILVTDGSGRIGSYTNFYRYDLWGNLIYSDRKISLSIVDSNDFSKRAGGGASMYIKHPAEIPPFEGFQSEWGQCFTVPQGQNRVLKSAKFFLGRAGSVVPTVNMFAVLYATTGTPNVDCVPANAPGLELAVSQPVNASVLVYGGQVITFNFNSTNQYLLLAGSAYGIAIHAHGPGTLYVDAAISVYGAQTADHPGNLFYFDGFSDGPDYDACSLNGCGTGPSDMVFEVDSSLSHESFTAYYNNGLPPGFNMFQETFSLSDGRGADNLWSTKDGYWMVKDGVYNGTKTGGQQESVFAWTDLGKADVSLQARFQITRGVDTDNRKIGVFVHYPGTGTSKWALVLRHVFSSGTWFELIDEGQTFKTITATVCSSINPIATGTWYTLNLTVKGYDAQGWAKAPGSAPCTIGGRFTNSNLAATGTGFGLYAGGYSALFDDITVTSVSPFITTTGFSNEFFYEGAPGGPGLNTWLYTKKQPDSSLWNVAGSWPSAASWTVAPYVQDFGQSPWGAIPGWRDTEAKWIWWNSDAETSSTDEQVWFRGVMNFRSAVTFLEIEITADDSYSLYIGGALLGSDTNWATREVYNTNVGPGTYVLAIAADNLGPSNPAGLLLSVRDTVTGQIVLRTSGVAGPNTIAPAGTAELQNGPGSTPVETYYAYNLWGGVSDKKQRYDSPTGVEWLTSRLTYDGQFGNPKTLTDPSGNAAYFEYSASFQNAYLTNQTQVLLSQPQVGITTLYSYNFTTGNQLSITDPKGNVTTYENDAIGRIKKITYPQSLGFVQYTYNDPANYVDITNSNGWKTRQAYDGLARLARIETFSGLSSYSNVTHTYDWNTKLASSRDPLGNVYRYGYDTLGRPVDSTKPDGNAVRQLYDDANSWIRTTDENGNYKCSIVDRLGRLISLIEKASADCKTGTVSNYYYDEVGDLVKVTNSNLKSTIQQYDNLRRLTRIEHPDGTFEDYTYNSTSNGNLAKRLDRRGVQTLYSYDSLSRLKTVTYCGNRITSDNYTYDKNGNLIRLESKNATITYAYDARNRPTSETYSVNNGATTIDLGCPPGTVSPRAGTSSSYTIGYSYVGEALDTITYPDGLVVKYNYDGLGRVSKVSKSGTSTTYATFSYYQNDLVKGIGFGNSVISNSTYDALSRPLLVTVKKGSNTLLSLTYGYNATGSISSVTGQVNGNVNEQYRYDQLGRLTNSTVTSSGATTSLWYEYENLGNRQRQSLNGQITSYGYNQTNNHLTSWTKTGTTVTYSYDKSGSLTGKNVTTGGTVRWTYTWDLAGRLAKVVKDGSNQGLYAYDANGRQLESVEGTTTTFYAYMGTETLYEKAGNTQKRYIYAAGLRLAKVSGTKVTYYHGDHLDSVRLVTNAQGNIAFSDNYQPFGQDNGTPTGAEDYKFTGKRWSVTIGLYYHYQRWYDPEIGRFTSADPSLGRLSAPQTINRHTYVANNPVIYTDPSGEALNLVTGLIGAAIGAAAGGLWCYYTNNQQWSDECTKAALVGALAGFVGGVTFSPGAGASVWTAAFTTIGVGALTGGASEVLAYTANYALTPGTQWDWNQFGQNVLVGAAIGAASAGLAAGLSRLAARSSSPLIRRIFGAGTLDFSPEGAGQALASKHKIWLTGSTDEQFLDAARRAANQPLSRVRPSPGGGPGYRIYGPLNQDWGVVVVVHGGHIQNAWPTERWKIVQYLL